MKYIFDTIISILFGVVFTISFVDHDTIIQYKWVGIAIGIGLAYAISKWNKDDINDLEKKIDDLEKKIDELKENDTRRLEQNKHR